MKPAKSSIARVLLVCFCLVSYLASASDDTASIDHIKGTLDILNEYIQADQMQFLQGWKTAELAALADVVPVQYQNRVVTALTGTDMDGVSQNPYHNTNAYLESLLRAFYGTVPNNNYPVSYSLSDYMSEMRYYLASMYLFQQTNRPSSFSASLQDILAGNPWWATNSAFTMTKYRLDQVYPVNDNIRLQSFPEFMSRWSARLTRPTNGRTWTSTQSKQDWWKSFGTQFSTEGYTDELPYTWFDFMSDAMRSNWVAQATEQRTLDSLLSASLSSGSTNIVNVVVTNIVGGTTNILNAEDILAGNPWWYTNSVFTDNPATLSTVSPVNPLTPTFRSFPEAFSEYMSFVNSGYQVDNYHFIPLVRDRWGLSKYTSSFPAVRTEPYTWFDWIADYLKSNLVLTTSTSESNMIDELYQAGFDTSVDDSITNTPLPGYEFPVEDVSSLQDVVASGETSFENFVDSISKPGTGGNSEIVVIPEFTVGGIHVREYRADLNTSIVPYCRRVLIFLYYVGVGVFIFQLAKSEYTYYATLGRHWGRY